MSFNKECFYCTKDERLDNLMIKICDLDASVLYLFKEQTYNGRCLVAHKDHVNELFDLTDEELNVFMKDVARAAKAVSEAFDAYKINYGAYADKMTHLHYHIVPKYEGGPDFGSTFQMMPEPKVLLSDEEYGVLIEKIKSKL